MRVKKKYSIGEGRIIWRLIPSGDKLLIEERDNKNKRVYYNCIEIESGNYLLKNFTTDEKFWSGVEAFEGDRIYFHRFIKPDMPGHIGIYVYDLTSGDYLWKTDDLVFLFLYAERVYVFNQKFESRDYFALDAVTGALIKEYGENAEEINKLREGLLQQENKKYKNYFFPETCDSKSSSEYHSLIEQIRVNEVISGRIDLLKYKDLLLLSYHTAANDGKLNNNFKVIEIDSGKIIFEVVLNAGITSYIPDSFFIRDNLLFLIKNKSELMVFSIV